MGKMRTRNLQAEMYRKRTKENKDGKYSTKLSTDSVNEMDQSCQWQTA